MHINTTAGEVHKELEQLGIYPWQYQDYKMISVNYNVVLSDIETYWNTEARFREGFKVNEEKKEIYIPNFFTKVNGIHHKMDDYKKFVIMLKDAKNTVVMNEEPAYYGLPKNKEGEKICSTIEEARKKNKEENFCELNIKDLMQGKFFIYKTEYTHFDELTSAKQRTVLSLIEEVVEKNKNEWDEQKMLLFISCCLNIPKSVAILLNNFDYSFHVPKILYTLDTMSEATAMYLWILNELGFDILLLQPSGKNTIERYFDINELSLGYFVENVDFKNIKTEEEIKQETEKITKEKLKQKQRKKKEKKENIKEFFEDIFEAVSEHILAVIWYMFAIAFPVLAIILWIYASGLVMFLTCFGYGALLIIIGCIMDDNCLFDSDAPGVLSLVVCAIVILLLCARGLHFLCTDDDINRSTHTHDGFFEIDESTEIGKNGFIIHYRKDAVGQDNYNNVYLYIENNAENTIDMYFIVKYKNKVIYESGKVEPLEYCPKITLNSDSNLPIGEHELQIEFYHYDADNKESKYTDEFLGKGTIKFHMYDTSKEVKNYKEENGMKEYCDD